MELKKHAMLAGFLVSAVCMEYDCLAMNGKDNLFENINGSNQTENRMVTENNAQQFLPSKSKWELTVNFLMIVGKYFETNNDFINVIRVNKKYKELLEMYKFNPIPDVSLFPNIKILKNVVLTQDNVDNLKIVVDDNCNIPEGVEKIEAECFDYWQLKAVSFPKTLKK